MRVTVVIGGLGGGGAERVCVNLANAWVARGLDVTLLTVSMKSLGSVYPLDARVVRRDLGWPHEPRIDAGSEAIFAGLRETGCEELSGELGLMTSLRAGILETRPDVVVAHMDLTSMRAIAALYGTGIPVIACEHTDPFRNSLGFRDRIRGLLYHRARTVVAPHDSTTTWLREHGIPARTIPNALVPPGTGRIACPPPARKRVVTLGRLSPEKRIDLLIRAFERIAPDFPDWDCEVYGDGPLRDELSRAATRVSIKGFTHQPYDALASADLYVSASAVEGFGNAIWEALACGVPVVAMDCGPAVRTLVRDGVDGRIVYGNEGDLAHTLGELMRDDDARQRLAVRASEARERYALDDVLRQWDEVLA